MRPENILLVDKACETTLNIMKVLDNVKKKKKTEQRVKMKIKCQQEALQKLQEEHGIIRQRLQDYDESKEI